MSVINTIKKHIDSIVFLTAVITLSLLYGYQYEILSPPRGIHIWRQCDSAQFAYNYYTQSMNFFEPRLSILLGNDGKTGSEFPLIYYIAALFYKIFGFHDFIIRFINLAFFYTGLYFLYRSICLVLNDRFYALCISLMVFTSSIVIDYANNFLPDVPALSLAFIGVYYFMLYKNDRNKTALIKSALFFALAGLIKVTMLMLFLSLAATGALVALAGINDPSFTLPKKHIAYFLFFLLTPVVLPAAWLIYVKHYNQINGNSYFLTNIVPVWSIGEEKLNFIVDMCIHRWRWQFLYQDFTNTLPVILIATLLMPYRKNAISVLWLLILIAANLVYLVLFFSQLNVHDYYLVCIIPVPIAVVTIFLLRLKDWKLLVFQSLFLKTAMAILLILMILDGEKRNRHREQRESWSYFEGFEKLKPVADSIGIKPNDKVFVAGDYSTGISLYLLQFRGLTSYHFEIYRDNMFDTCMARGIKYVITTPDEEAKISPQERSRYLSIKLAEAKEIKFYRLQ